LPISSDDIKFIEAQADLHELDPQTADRVLRISIVAFFSNTEDGSPACDGFYLYSAQTKEIYKWSREQNHFTCERTHVVNWINYDELHFKITEAKAPCPGGGAP
jgi:hypothetical protein